MLRCSPAYLDKPFLTLWKKEVYMAVSGKVNGIFSDQFAFDPDCLLRLMQGADNNSGNPPLVVPTAPSGGSSTGAMPDDLADFDVDFLTEPFGPLQVQVATKATQTQIEVQTEGQFATVSTQTADQFFTQASSPEIERAPLASLESPSEEVGSSASSAVYNNEVIVEKKSNEWTSQENEKVKALEKQFFTKPFTKEKKAAFQAECANSEDQIEGKDFTAVLSRMQALRTKQRKSSDWRRPVVAYSRNKPKKAQTKSKEEKEPTPTQEPKVAGTTTKKRKYNPWTLKEVEKVEMVIRDLKLGENYKEGLTSKVAEYFTNPEKRILGRSDDDVRQKILRIFRNRKKSKEGL